jgi:heme exporter protein C
MKFVIMFGAIILAALFAAIGGYTKPKALWWKVIAIVMVAFALILTILPPVSGNLATARYIKEGFYENLNLHITNKTENHYFDAQSGIWFVYFGNKPADLSDPTGVNFNRKLVIHSKELPHGFSEDSELVIKAGYDKENDAIKFIETKYVNPLFDYPFVPNLDERIKILNLHVPMAWIAVIAYLMSMIYAIRYLKSGDLKWDINTASAAALGNLFAILATVTGMLWAKYNWGTYWNWDPRQTSIFVLILIYAAFFALRAAIDNPERRAKLSSVYSIISFVTVPFLVFILPRMASGLHPGSADDVNAGPLVSAQPSALDTNLVWGFGLSLFAFTVIYFWLFNILVRMNIIKNKLS